MAFTCTGQRANPMQLVFRESRRGAEIQANWRIGPQSSRLQSNSKLRRLTVRLIPATWVRSQRPKVRKRESSLRFSAQWVPPAETPGSAPSTNRRSLDARGGDSCVGVRYYDSPGGLALHVGCTSMRPKRFWAKPGSSDNPGVSSRT